MTAAEVRRLIRAQPRSAERRDGYWKRFGDATRNLDPRGQEPIARTNLADDLQKWLAHGSIDPEVHTPDMRAAR